MIKFQTLGQYLAVFGEEGRQHAARDIFGPPDLRFHAEELTELATGIAEPDIDEIDLKGDRVRVRNLAVEQAS